MGGHYFAFSTSGRVVYEQCCTQEAPHSPPSSSQNRSQWSRWAAGASARSSAGLAYICTKRGSATQDKPQMSNSNMGLLCIAAAAGQANTDRHVRKHRARQRASSTHAESAHASGGRTVSPCTKC
eukprot:1158867-Pelagomonas_calceolata.AAC.34